MEGLVEDVVERYEEEKEVDMAELVRKHGYSGSLMPLSYQVCARVIEGDLRIIRGVPDLRIVN